ncbi:hypothetical protein MRB53_015941 [Persea americana]|uniref:Uncharacterized protein n=1 Tax=Persea americana TaxID=3435 RepID=A0ACC2M0P4_PERAE|nr:hypothetical protein MRB53_015941 [Persea americana]
MRAAMATAEVDDDIVAFDPTAFQFEREMVRIMGKVSALFVPSGTMGNLISVLVHCEIRGSEAIVGDKSHIYVYENGGISTLGGVHSRIVKDNVDGTMDIALVEAAIREPADYLYDPTTRLICLENTHASCGGRCISLEYTNRVGEVAKKHGLKLHIDGARIFNASVVCLSKGLGAPVGSVIVGSKGFITKVKRLRKALENKDFADGLNQIKGLEVDMASVKTNIVFFDMTEGVNFVAEDLIRVFEKLGVLVWQMHNGRCLNFASKMND